MRILFLLVLLTSFQAAQARVFQFHEQGFGALLEGSFGTTLMGQEGFATNLGGGVSMGDSLNYMQSGKLGVIYNTGSLWNLSFYVEMVKPLSISGTSAKNNSGTELYLFSSSALALNPSFSFEYIYRQIGNVRYFLGFQAGYGRLSMTNKYEINSLGQAQLGVDSYSEKLIGDAYNGAVSLGLEAHFVDQSTFVFQAGHRIFKIHELKHDQAALTLSEGQVLAGEVVRNGDGSKRKLDLSGTYISLGFRFYIP